MTIMTFYPKTKQKTEKQTSDSKLEVLERRKLRIERYKKLEEERGNHDQTN